MRVAKQSAAILLLVLLLIGGSASFGASLGKLYGLTHPLLDSNSKSCKLVIVASSQGYATMYSSNSGYVVPASGTFFISGNGSGLPYVRLLVYPYVGYTFDHWEINGVAVNAVNDSNAYTLILKNDTTVEPVFSSKSTFDSSLPLYQTLIALANEINFTGNAAIDNTDPGAAFMIEHLTGLQLGIFSIQDLADFASSLINQNTSTPLKAEEILYAYTVLMPYGIANQTVIEWALDNQPMLTNGLPDTGTPFGLKSAFWLQYRYTLNGYYWAQLYSYDVQKWNITLAYQSFESALVVQSDGCPATLYVTASGGTYCYWGNGHPRYYDECAETIDSYLRFYQLGVNDALPKAVDVWNYLNANDWYSDHYGYFVGNDSFECEAGGFYQIALKLKYYDPSLSYIGRIFTDAYTRFLKGGFSSIQWASNQGGFIVHDYAIDGASARLENTLISWASLYGEFLFFDGSQQTCVQNMINGVGTPGDLEAWQYTLSADGMNTDSQLYNSNLTQFEWQMATPASWNVFATSAAESLLILLGVSPVNTTLAVPLNENIYEDLTSTVNQNIICLNLNASLLQVAVASEGALAFHYGTEQVSYTFPRSGVYSVQFSSDWNHILSVTRIRDISEGLYYASDLPVTGSNSDLSYSHPVLSLQTSTFNDTLAQVSVANLTNGSFTEVSGPGKSSTLSPVLSQPASMQDSNSSSSSFSVGSVNFSQIWLVAMILCSQIFVGSGVLILVILTLSGRSPQTLDESRQ